MTLFLVLPFALSGCEDHYALAPPRDSEMVTLSVKISTGLAVRPIQVIYRSSRCLRDAVYADGTRYKIPGYQNMQVQPVRMAGSDIYEHKVSVEGGGACEWRLSNVMFGVVVDNPARFGEGIVFGSGGRVVVRFDNNNAPIGGGDIAVEGDLMISKDYYPWIKERFVGGYRNSVSLLGAGPSHEAYQALQARRVHYEPTLHLVFPVRSVGPKVKRPGYHTQYFYPDGTTEVHRTGRPDFKKLQSIRRNTESSVSSGL